MTEDSINKNYWSKLEQWGDMLDKDMDEYSIDQGFKNKINRRAEEAVVIKDSQKMKEVKKEYKKNEGKAYNVQQKAKDISQNTPKKPVRFNTPNRTMRPLIDKPREADKNLKNVIDELGALKKA